MLSNLNFFSDENALKKDLNWENPFGDGKFKDPSKKDEIALENTRQPPKKFHCPEPFKRMTLRGNGDVLGCCSFYAVDLVMGNWKKESLGEIWNSEKMKKLRGKN